MTRTCNEAGLLTGEEADHVGHLLDGPDPAQGVGGLAVLQELLVVLLSQTAPLVDVRHDHARVHRVHSHSLAGQVQGCTPSQTFLVYAFLILKVYITFPILKYLQIV